MKVSILDSAESAGKAAAERAAALITKAVAAKGRATIVLATGASQFALLDHLTARSDIDWSRVEAFHLDEYTGLSSEHPASFRRYLRDRFVSRVDHLGAFHGIEGDATDTAAECRRLSEAISSRSIDLSLIGIGENAHLAFNDPPADFETETPYRIATLDTRCREQQYGEGWFPSVDAVPHQAITMTIPQILKSDALVVTVPDRRKAEAVRCTLEGPITPACPASILQTHDHCDLFLDTASAALLARPEYRSRDI